MLLGYHRAAQKRARRNGSRAEFPVDGDLVVRADITIIAIDVQTCQIRSGQGMTTNSHPKNAQISSQIQATATNRDNADVIYCHETLA